MGLGKTQLPETALWEVNPVAKHTSRSLSGLRLLRLAYHKHNSSSELHHEDIIGSAEGVRFFLLTLARRASPPMAYAFAHMATTVHEKRGLQVLAQAQQQVMLQTLVMGGHLVRLRLPASLRASQPAQLLPSASS
ncbi:hypothetical protein CERZMDRAFT_100560 [Cercospora zeae-maydis SCOH1-5]|uniref:Uncharacterized protein n=1 Tax=Cercospora zeae-maydis SCOH1-5 TaxID=717836 RepID=A0A6A6F4I4_9PEZI|nr:hypothetical protein CERZMDRAFT_100560 [Cercospora zeae-maydis SCOH1-5]